MSTPLSPISPQLLNARTPETASKFSIAGTSPAKGATFEDESLIDWREEASSPFVAEIDQNTMQASQDYFLEQTPSKSRSPSKTMVGEITQELYMTTPAMKGASRESAFQIHEDEPAIETTPRPDTRLEPAQGNINATAPKRSRSSIKRADSYERPPTNVSSHFNDSAYHESESVLRSNEGLTITMKNLEEETRNRSFTHVAVTEEAEYIETEAT
ncbi:hypothetical protein LTS18_006025, partial [Coniosporium uncinatum]